MCVCCLLCEKKEGGSGLGDGMVGCKELVWLGECCEDGEVERV